MSIAYEMWISYAAVGIPLVKIKAVPTVPSTLWRVILFPIANAIAYFFRVDMTIRIGRNDAVSPVPTTFCVAVQVSIAIVTVSVANRTRIVHDTTRIRGVEPPVERNARLASVCAAWEPFVEISAIAAVPLAFSCVDC